MKQIKRLGDAELDIMQVIWSSDIPVNSQFISQGLEGKRDWQLATILTVLSRLVAKGFLEVERRGRNNYYVALISRQEYQEFEGRELLERLYSGSVKGLVSSLVGGKAIDKKDISELRGYLDKLEQE